MFHLLSQSFQKKADKQAAIQEYQVVSDTVHNGTVRGMGQGCGLQAMLVLGLSGAGTGVRTTGHAGVGTVGGWDRGVDYRPLGLSGAWDRGVDYRSCWCAFFFMCSG